MERCRKPKYSYDCEGVKAYLDAHPLGTHAADAKSALNGSRSTLESLHIAEERSAEAENRRAEQEERRQARKECEKDCLGGVCFNLRPGSFEVCMARCVKANCD